ncbi:MAG: hypothetical protein WC979_00965 [Candidatus Pacearchaeota archaeon]|jgi:hypothetical protein|nr:hypothetical protein [Clostridia bacterium]
METIEYTCPFMGKITLTRVGESSSHLQGESVVKTYYIDRWKNFYIDIWNTCGGDPIPMIKINRDVFDKLVEIDKDLKTNQIPGI